MKITKKDERDNEKIAQLIKKIDSFDARYANSESEIIARKQPFLISLILGYGMDLKEDELEEIVKIILLVWEYFKSSEKVMKVKISEKRFEKFQRRNLQLVKNLEGKDGNNIQKELVESSLSRLKSKALLTGILYQFTHKKSLKEMKAEKKGMILIGMKSLIDCFDEL